MFMETTASLLMMYKLLLLIFWSRISNTQAMPIAEEHPDLNFSIENTSSFYTLIQNPVMHDTNINQKPEKEEMVDNHIDFIASFQKQQLDTQDEEDTIDQNMAVSEIITVLNTLSDSSEEFADENTQKTNWWLTTIEWIEKTEDCCLEYLTNRNILVVSLFMNIILLLHYSFGPVSVTNRSDSVSEYSGITRFEIMIL